MTRAYRVSEVRGAAIVNEALGRDGTSIQSVQFGDKRLKIIGSRMGSEVVINADIASMEIYFDLNAPSRLGLCEFANPDKMFLNLRIGVPFYTIQTKDTPVKMTLDEIEKKLGYKVSIVNKEGDS